MASWIAGLLFAAGASAWIYNVLMKQTGSNTKASIIVTVIAFIFCFVIFWSVFDFAAGLAKQ
jgi:multidrug transporter EmrE-like cation transporter